MKKNFLTLSAIILACMFIGLSCQKKNSSGISPGYKEDKGTGGNPFPNNPTVTGSPTTNVNPATNNSNLPVGGTGWSNPTCASSASTTLVGVNGSVSVTLTFFSPPSTGTYVISAAPTQSQTCSMTVVNAPNQPSGIVWYAQSGLIAVTTTTNAINATFSGVICVQQSFSFPQVSVSGVLGCN